VLRVTIQTPTSPSEYRYLHNFLTLKYNELQVRIAPSPVGEGWGEENKIKALPYSPHPTFSLWRRLLDLCKYLCLLSEDFKPVRKEQ